MIILGIDPGTAITGYGVIDKERGKITPLAFGVIRTDSDQAAPERLQMIYNELEEVMDRHEPSEAAVEQIFFNTNAKTAISVGQARGVAVLSLANRGLEIGEYTPLQIKQAVCGYGRADKKQIQDMVQNLLGLKKRPKPDDAADGLAVAICHAHSAAFNSAVRE